MLLNSILDNRVTIPDNWPRIAKKFKFKHISHSEDTDFSLQIHNSKLLKKE